MNEVIFSLKSEPFVKQEFLAQELPMDELLLSLKSEPFVIERDFCPLFPSNKPASSKTVSIKEGSASQSSSTSSKHMFENCDCSRCVQPRRKVRHQKEKLVLAELFVRSNSFKDPYERSKILKAPDATEIPKELVPK